MKYDIVSGQLNAAWLNGFAEEEYGSCQEEGFSAALIVIDAITGIIEENDRGEVSYEIHETEKEARDRWAEMVTGWEQAFHPEAFYA
tara:strand:+ start:315 stop:575 length:261 start_codon:yes stop_codon:yes gene_type:complete